jgi:hypothetical protein
LFNIYRAFARLADAAAKNIFGELPLQYPHETRLKEPQI